MSGAVPVTAASRCFGAFSVHPMPKSFKVPSFTVIRDWSTAKSRLHREVTVLLHDFGRSDPTSVAICQGFRMVRSGSRLLNCKKVEGLSSELASWSNNTWS